MISDSQRWITRQLGSFTFTDMIKCLISKLKELLPGAWQKSLGIIGQACGSREQFIFLSHFPVDKVDCLKLWHSMQKCQQHKWIKQGYEFRSGLKFATTLQKPTYRNLSVSGWSRRTINNILSLVIYVFVLIFTLHNSMHQIFLYIFTIFYTKYNINHIVCCGKKILHSNILFTENKMRVNWPVCVHRWNLKATGSVLCALPFRTRMPSTYMHIKQKAIGHINWGQKNLSYSHQCILKVGKGNSRV